MSQSKENKVIIDGIPYYGGLNQPNLKFVKVNVDCWEKIFDLLSLEDVLSMSQTCQRMRQIGGYYFRENYRGIACRLSGKFTLTVSIAGNQVERIDFLRFVDTIEIQDKVNHLRHLSSVNALTALTTLRMFKIVLNQQQLQGLENIQPNIETLDLISCRINDYSVGEFLALCPKLKCLRLDRIEFKSDDVAASIFQRNYPKLEQFEYQYCSDMTFKLKALLERNPTINWLRIPADDLQLILVQKSPIQLDKLCIDITWLTANANKILSRFKTLGTNGLAKKLRVSIEDLPEGFDGEPFIRKMTAFAALEVMETYHFYKNLYHLSQLEELCVWYLKRSKNLDAVAINLVNLERLYVECTVDQLLTFIRHSKKLKFIMFRDVNDDSSPLDLHNLNRVRQMAGIKQKISIAVDEDKYLATKWKNKNGANYNLIEVCRRETLRKYFHT